MLLTLLEAWRLRERLRNEGDSPRPWLMGIAVNVLRNTSRVARRHEKALIRLPLRGTVTARTAITQWTVVGEMKELPGAGKA